jgi:hypothetical protein
VIGNELQDTPSAFGHLGALRDLGNSTEIALRHDFNDVPLVLASKAFLMSGASSRVMICFR